MQVKHGLGCSHQVQKETATPQCLDLEVRKQMGFLFWTFPRVKLRYKQGHISQWQRGKGRRERGKEGGKEGGGKEGRKKREREGKRSGETVTTLWSFFGGGAGADILRRSLQPEMCLVMFPPLSWHCPGFYYVPGSFIWAADILIGRDDTSDRYSGSPYLCWDTSQFLM